ncbi:hypothetical protein ABVT39_020252 [Epinephelus coioides]
MAVCVNCNHDYSRLIERLKSVIRKKDRILDGFIVVAATQSKHISYLQSSSHLAPSQVASDSAAMLPWLPSLYADITPSGPRDTAAELSGSSAGQLVAGAPDTTTSTAAGDGEAPPKLPPDLVVGNGTGLLLVHTSTPKLSGSSWTEVRCGPKGDPAAGRVPPVELSNHFTILMDKAPVHPSDSPAVLASTAHPAAATCGRRQHSRSLRCVSSTCGWRHLSCNHRCVLFITGWHILSSCRCSTSSTCAQCRSDGGNGS